MNTAKQVSDPLHKFKKSPSTSNGLFDSLTSVQLLNRIVFLVERLSVIEQFIFSD